MRLCLPLLLSCTLLNLNLAAQDLREPESNANYEFRISKSSEAIRVDGQLEESAWKTATQLDQFRYNFPVDTGFTTTLTEVRATFDDKNLYFGIKCWQPRSSYTIQSLKRDFPGGTSDVINVLLSPFKDGLNGFLFGVNPFNVQREAILSNGSTIEFEWDNRWTSAVENYEEFWIVELAIPFKSIRYKSENGQNSWHINFVRTRLQPWEVSTWHPVPQQFAPNNLAFSGLMVWDSPPPAPKKNIAIIPYVRTAYNTDYVRDKDYVLRDKSGKFANGIGGDAKIAITPSLNLDLTINPDFSQVEVDRQVANLSRFELFFPERRQFFLENRDLFAMFGFPSTRPFFSRRIGLAENPITRQNQTVPILAGARLSGKINDQWRIGLLNMQTDRVDWDSSKVLPAVNYTVATVQRKVFERSTISAIFVNKQNQLNKLNESQQGNLLPWNRVAGLEFNLNSKDNRWEGEWYYHRSFSPDKQQRGQTLANFIGYNDRHWSTRIGYVLVDSNYTADAGFLPRIGYQSYFPGIRYKIYPKSKYFNVIGIGVDGDLTSSLFFKETDRDIFANTSIEFKNQSRLEVGFYNSYTYLFDPFDPTQLRKEGATPLPGNSEYTYNGFRGEMFSSSSYNLQGSLRFNLGQFFNGTLRSISGEILYRWQPYGIFAMSYSYNDIQLPAPYPSARFWILGPRAELSFSKNLFVSTFFQYNTQANNFNINTRLQWRFAPVSDIYLVYTDNSFAQEIGQTNVRFLTPKNKAIILKVSYWFNL